MKDWQNKVAQLKVAQAAGKLKEQARMADKKPVNEHTEMDATASGYNQAGDMNENDGDDQFEMIQDEILNSYYYNDTCKFHGHNRQFQDLHLKYSH